MPELRQNQPPIADHRDIIRLLSDEQRRRLRQTSDRVGLFHLVGHVGLIVAGGAYIVLALPLWQLVLVPHGIVLIFLFTLLHETTHDTPFKSGWLNRTVGILTGFIVALPPTWFKYFHMAHHRHTHDLDNDPELATPKPQNWRQYVIYLSGLPTWVSEMKKLFSLAGGGKIDDFVPVRATGKVRLEARLFIACYIGLALASLWFSNPLILWLWIVPVLLGQPFLRAYLLAEHGLCPHVANMLDNSRTTYTMGLVRYLAWNMPYHTEHHTYPVVPFHKLPELHRIMREHLRQTENGYVVFHGKYVRRF